MISDTLSDALAAIREYRANPATATCYTGVDAELDALARHMDDVRTILDGLPSERLAADVVVREREARLARIAEVYPAAAAEARRAGSVFARHAERYRGKARAATVAANSKPTRKS
jgi:hypothetical protein